MSVTDDRAATVGARGGPGSASLNPFAFIVGCARSGTTLLGRMVDAHPSLTAIHEMGWLPRPPADRALVDAGGFIRGTYLERLIERPRFARYAPMPVGRNELEALLHADKPIRYADFVAWLLDRHAAARGKPFVVNKSVDNAPHVATLAALWPKAKFVHLIRDGRDVSLSAMSWRRAPKLAQRFPTWLEDPVVTSALWWEWHVRTAREAGAQLGPDRYWEVRYEELVRRPEATCAALCAFLGVPFDEAVVRFHEKRAQANGDLDAKHAWRPPTPGLRDWRTQMSLDDLTRWEAASGDLLDELAYPRSSAAPSGRAIARAAALRQAFEGRPLPARWRARHAATGAGCTIWLTGLSGAGKSTVARLVEDALRRRGRRVEVLDGDAVRRNLSAGLGFSREDRDANIRRIAYVADLLSRNGVTVVAAAISPFRAARDEARALMGDRFIEVHVRASIDACAARDVKGLYAKARAGEIERFTGVSDVYEPPLRPDVVLETERETPQESAQKVLAHLDARSPG
jgi:adenylyl-sulfate kinase